MILNTLPILIATIIIILTKFIKKRHFFWENQPVMRKVSNKLEIIGTIPKFKLKFNNNITMTNALNKDDIYKFLNKNFNNNYNINYPYFLECFNQTNSRNISLNYKKAIIGFIHSEPLDIIYNNKVIKFQYVDYLCVDKLYRNKNCASLLISKLLQSFENKKTVLLFKREDIGLPFIPIINTNYYYSDLTKYLPNKIENVWHIINRLNEIDTIYNYYKQLTSKYKLRTFYSKRKFRYIFIESKILDLFVIENKSGYNTLVIGKKNSYKINSKIENCFEIDLILGELRYVNYLNNNLSNILKNNGYNFFTIPDIAHHTNFIQENNLIESMKLYYYSYNINIPPIKKTEFCMNIN